MEDVAYFVALVSAFLALSAATALRPGRRGLAAALAYPVGWAAGELAGQAIIVEAVLLAILAWWGWPQSTWLSDLVVVLAVLVALENVALVAILFRSRTIVRRALEEAVDRPLTVPRPRDDRFGSWWRTALLIPLHPADMQLIRDVHYGPAPRHRLDIWRTSTTPKGAPVIFYLHGGAWTFGDKREQGRPMLHEFVRRGWVVVASNYRLAPRDPWPAQIEDATRALGWIKKSIAAYGGDPERVVVAGGSAGGHLASLLALSGRDPRWRPSDGDPVSDWRVRGALSFYGVLEMTGDEEYWAGLGGGIRRLLEGRVVQQPYEGNELVYRSMSPYEWVDRTAPPFFVVQGGNDTLVEVNVARAFVERFRRLAFAPIYYVELPFTQHAFDVTASPRTSATTRAAVAFATSVVETRGAPSAELAALYQVPPTELLVEVGAGQWLAANEAARSLGAFFVVTSDNPASVVLSERENEARRAELRSLLTRTGVDFVATRAVDPSGRFPDERGVALLQSTTEEARALADLWGQFAYYEIDSEGVRVRDARHGELIT